MPLSARDNVHSGFAAIEVWVFLAAFAVQVLVLWHLAASSFLAPSGGDMKFYNDWAQRLAHGEPAEPKAFYGLPGYPYLLVAVYEVTNFLLFLTGFATRIGRPHPLAMGLLQAAANAAVACLMVKIARLIFVDGRPVKTDSPLHRWKPEIIGMLGAAGWIFFQPAQSFSVVLMPTIWLVFAFWLCVYVSLRAEKRSITNPWLWLGLLIGLVATVVATILFLLPFVLAIIWFHRGADSSFDSKRKLAACFTVVAGLFVGTAPCWVHNYFVAGEPVLLSAHSGINFYIGNNPRANGYTNVPPGMRAGQAGMLKDSITMAESAAGRPLKRTEVSRYWKAQAVAFIRTQPGAWLRLMLIKFRNFWSYFQYDDLSLISLFSQKGIITPGIRFGFVAALAIPGLIICARRYPVSRWVIGALLLHLCALMPVFITERYRLAVVPGLLLLAAAGLWELWQWIITRDYHGILTYAGLGVPALLFVSWPQSDRGLWSLDFTNVGIAATESGDLERGQRNLEMAYAYVPDNAEINFALGNLWLKKSDRDKAKSFYRHTVELDARHAGAWNNLGVMAMQETRWDLADKFLSASLDTEPEDAKTWYLLAKVKREKQDLPAARAALDQALKLKKDQPEFQALQHELGP